MYSLRLNYSSNSSEQYKDSITYCAVLDLYLNHGIDAAQSSASIITLETAQARTLALLALSGFKEYTVTVLD